MISRRAGRAYASARRFIHENVQAARIVAGPDGIPSLGWAGWARMSKRMGVRIDRELRSIQQMVPR
jgi:hypothetical protein